MRAISRYGPFQPRPGYLGATFFVGRIGSRPVDTAKIWFHVLFYRLYSVELRKGPDECLWANAAQQEDQKVTAPVFAMYSTVCRTQRESDMPPIAMQDLTAVRLEGGRLSAQWNNQAPKINY